MRRKLRFFGALLALLLACGASAEWQGRMTPNDAIDKAGMQRMLTQRILKAYCEIGLSELYGSPRDQLTHAVDLFDANLLQLGSFVKEPEIGAALDQVKAIWPNYRKMALQPATREGAAMMLDLNHKLLPLTHAVVVKMEKTYGTTAGPWVNMAGRQRMLSQRLAMFYMLRQWGAEDAKGADAVSSALADYSLALDKLETFAGNTPETLDLIANLRSGFRLLQRALGQHEENLSFLVATTSERMLESADRLTGLYASLEKK